MINTDSLLFLYIFETVVRTSENRKIVWLSFAFLSSNFFYFFVPILKSIDTGIFMNMWKR